ncbi:hypothetical protein Hanom_Chr16g01438521 [Helianthus anomalus]
MFLFVNEFDGCIHRKCVTLKMNFKYVKTSIMKEILWYIFSAASFQLKRVRMLHVISSSCVGGLAKIDASGPVCCCGIFS